MPETVNVPALLTEVALNALNATNSMISPLAAADVRPTTDPSVAVKSCATTNFDPFKYTSR